MKIEQKFKPLVISIESEQEVIFLRAICASYFNKVHHLAYTSPAQEESRIFAEELYKELEKN